MDLCDVYIMWKHFTVTLALLAVFATLAAGKSDPGIIDVVIEQVKSKQSNVNMVNSTTKSYLGGSATDCRTASLIGQHQDIHKT